MANNKAATKDLSYWLTLRGKSGERNRKHIQRNINGTYEKVNHTDGDSSTVLWINREPATFSLHWHSCAEIVMPIENGYTVKLNKQTYELHEKDILIIPPGELHELIAPPSGTRLILLCDLTVMNKFKSFVRSFSLLSNSCLITPETMPEIHEQELELLLRVAEEYSYGGELGDPSVLALLIQFFVLWARSNQDNHPAALPDMQPNKQREYVEKFNIVFDYIEQHYMEDITLESTAAQISFSKFHFSRLFRQFTDTSFYDYLCARRIKAAEALLLDPNLPITEIALQSGFASISTFNRVFKKFKECTPSEFKEFNKEAVRNR